MSDNVTGSDVVSTPTPATPGASTPSAATPAVPQSAPATPSASSLAPATPGAEPSRENWVPPYRLREVREAAVREAQSQWGARESQFQSEINQLRTQLQALVGANPQTQNSEADVIKKQFGTLFPELMKLSERADQVQELLERAGDIESQNAHYWQQYGRQTMDRLFDHASKSVGTLTEEGKRALHSAFTGFVQSSPELTARYAQDPTLVDEFWQAFSSNLIDPVRRSASAATATRAAGVALPQDTPGSAAVVSQAPKPADMDERAKSGWAAYQHLISKA